MEIVNGNINEFKVFYAFFSFLSDTIHLGTQLASEVALSSANPILVEVRTMWEKWSNLRSPAELPSE